MKPLGDAFIKLGSHDCRAGDLLHGRRSAIAGAGDMKTVGKAGVRGAGCTSRPWTTLALIIGLVDRERRAAGRGG